MWKTLLPDFQFNFKSQCIIQKDRLQDLITQL